jgi:hypothetical protein
MTAYDDRPAGRLDDPMDDRLDDRLDAPMDDRAADPMDGRRADPFDPMAVTGHDDVGPARSDAWDRLAGGFVDDPQDAVAQARLLVERAVDVIAPAQDGTRDNGSTEDLRAAFRRLRDAHRTLSAL